MQRFSKYLIGFIVLFGAAWLMLLPGQSSGPAINRWTVTADMASARAAACSALLTDGRVLVAGGNGPSGVTNTVELYNPDGTFASAPPMKQARTGASCVALQDGRVLVAGGSDGTTSLASAEVFDPAKSAWTPIDNMEKARYRHTATLLPWGAVLIEGGEGSGTVELYRTNDTFLTVGQLSTARQDYAVAAISNRRVLIIGGSDGRSALSSIDVFNANDNSISPAGQMLTARTKFGASTLLDGTVLITGGYDADGNILQSSEIFDPAKGESVAGPDMGTRRAEHQSYTLPNNGSVILIGGTDGASNLTVTETYPYWSGKFTKTGSMNSARSGLVSTLLRRGGLVVAGGRNSSGVMAGSEAYGFATISTSKSDYQPGDVATMTGTGFKPGEQVSIKVTLLPADVHNVEFTAVATADAAGKISAGGFNIDSSHLHKRFILTATGSESIAQTTFTDAPATTTTTITAANPPSPQNAPSSGSLTASFTVNVAPQVDGGTVRIIVDGVSGNLVTANTAIMDNIVSQSSYLIAGNHNITAHYETGDAVNFTSSDTAASVPYNVTPIGITSVNITVPGGTPTYGTSITLSASLTPSAGVVPAGCGNIQFFDHAYSDVLIGTTAYTGNPTNLSVSTLTPTFAIPAGHPAHDIEARFIPNSGSCNYSAQTSVGPNNQSIGFANPGFTLTVSPANIAAGQPFTLTATYTAVAGVSGTPQGSITFTVGGNPTPAAPLSNGSASYTFNAGLTATSYVVTGTYATTDFLFDQPGGFSLGGGITISKNTPLISVTTNPSSTVGFAGPVTATATMSLPANATASGLTFGTGVAFSVDGVLTSCTNVALTFLQAQCALPTTMTVGSHNISATYANAATDPNFLSVSTQTGTPNLTVTQATTVTTVTPSASTINLGASETYTVSVTQTPSSNPPGTVVVNDGATQICGPASVPLVTISLSAANPATGTCTVPVTTGGTHNIQAVYTGTTTSGNSTSATQSITVNKSPVTVTLTAPTATTYGNFTVLNATLPAPGAGQPAYTGGIQFYDNGVAIGSPVAVAGNAASTPNTIFSATPTNHPITAQLLNDPSYSSVASAAGTLSIAKATPTFVPAALSITASYGGSIGSPTQSISNATGNAGVASATGTIGLAVGGTSLGSFTMSGNPGSATGSGNLPTSIAAGSGQTLTVSYSGDNNYASATASGTLNVNKADPTSASLTASVNPLSAGGTETFTLTVTASAGTPGGTANFWDGPVGTGTLLNAVPVAVTNGVATLAVTSTSTTLANGNHTINAVYLGDSNFNGVASIAMTGNPLVVGPEATTTSVVANNNNPVVGATVIYTVTVSGNPATPAGTVSVTDNTVNFTAGTDTCGSAIALVSGSATCQITYDGTTAGKLVGSHAIKATFNPTTPAAQQSSNGTTTVVVAGASSTTVTTPNLTGTPLTYGQTTTLTATVSPHPAGTPYASVVQFVDTYNGSTTTLGSATPVTGTGVATLSGILLGGGTHSITAQYLGTADSNYPQSVPSVPATPTVARFNLDTAPSYTLVGDTGTVGAFSNAYYGGPVFGGSAKITYIAACGTCVLPSGSVYAQIGTTTFGTYPIVGGVATLGTTTLPLAVQAAPGGTTITFHYAGDSNYLPDPPSGSIVINKVTPALGNETLTLAASPTSSTFGQNVNFTFTVSSSVAGASPSGTADFYDGTIIPANKLGTVSVVNGSAVFATSGLGNGGHTITAVYGGDANFSGGNSNALSYSVGAEATTTQIQANNTTPTVGTTVTYTITVSGSPAVPVGTVSLQDNLHYLDSCGATMALNGSGVAICTIQYDNTLNKALGAHSMTSAFTPTVAANFSTSTATAITVTVGGQPVTVSAITGTAAITYPATDSFSVTLSPANPTPYYGANSVQFRNIYNGNSTVLCNVTPVGNPATATCNVAAGVLQGGSNTVIAQFMGDTNYGASTVSASYLVTVTKGTLTSANFSTPSSVSVAYGGTLPLATETLTGLTGGAVPTGTIASLSAGSTAIGGPFTINGGAASYGPLTLPTSLSATPGTYTLSFAYSGDNNYNAFTYTTGGSPLTVTKDTPNFTLVSTSPLVGGNPTSSVNQPVTFTLTLTSPTTGTPTTPGVTVVSFKDGSTAIGTSTLTNGIATFNTGQLNAGTHPMTAVYLGDNNFNGVTTSPAVNQVVQAANTSITVSASNSTPAMGTLETFSVTVVAPQGSPAPVAASVTVQETAGLDCTVAVPLTAGTGSLSNTATGSCSITYDGSNTQKSSGTHVVTATFNTNDAAQWSNATSVPITVTAGVTPTTTSAITAAPTTTPTYAQAITLSVTVTPVAPPTYTGTVQFMDTYNGASAPLCGPTTPINPCPTPNGAGLASITTGVQTLHGGNHSIVATFGGDANYGVSSSSALLLPMALATPTISASGDPGLSVVFGSNLASNPITVTGVTGGAAPSGAVTVMGGPGNATVIGTATFVSSVGNVQSWAINTPVPLSLGVGAAISLQFNSAADNNYVAATKGATFAVTPFAAPVTVSSAPATSLFGQSVTLSATFSPVAGAPIAGGSVSILDGATVVCASLTITNNVASCPVTNLSVGAHTLTVASFSGDNRYTMGAITTGSVTVGQDATSTVVTSAANPSSPGQAVILTATISITAPGADPFGTGGQTVSFFNNSSPITGCQNLAVSAVGLTGVATCNTSFATGNGNPGYPITAIYSGDTKMASSTSPILFQIVSLPKPAVSVSSSTPNPAYGQPVTFTATVVGINSITPTGVVSFLDGTTILAASQPLSASNPVGTATATLTITSPPLFGGAHSITAVYVPNGDPNYSTNTSGIFTLTVTKAASAITAIGISVNPAVFGQPVTLSVTVSPYSQPSSAVPGASCTNPTAPCSVSFMDGSTTIGTVPVSVGASSSGASLNNVTLSVGSHASVTAVFNGDNNFGTVTSAAATLNVNPANTSTTITSITPASASFGQTVTMTAKVLAVAPGAGSPTSTISFYDGSTANLIATSGPVDASGVATVSIAANNPPLVNPLEGNHNIIAVYNGNGISGSTDGNFKTSTSASSALAVGKTNTTTAVVSSVNPSVTGQLVTFTATITTTGFGTAPTGTVVFALNGSPIGSSNVTVNGGVSQATLTAPSTGVNALPDGNLIISAAYSGDNNYNASNSPLTSGAGALQQVVNKANTTTVLSSSTNTSVVGQPVTLVATVTVNAPGTGIPTGTVNFYNTVDNVPASIGSSQLVPAGGQNAANIFLATVTLPALPQGQLNLTAVYSGDNAYNTSTSTAITQIVGRPPVTVSVTANLNPSIYGQPVTFTANVAPIPPGSGTPSGTAIFYDGTTQLVQVALVGGQATYTATLAPGTHAIAVSYSGDANFNPYISNAVPEIVSRIPSSLSLATNAVTAVASQVVTFTAQISPTPPAGVAFATGQIAFFDGSAQIGVGQLSSGVATVSTAQISTGLHYISAVYIGDTNWTGATSAFVPQTITLAQTNVQMASSVNPSVYSQPVTFTIGVGVAFPGTVPASGQVQLYDNTVAVGSPASVNNGQVAVTLGNLAPGTHNIIAQYVGNPSFASASSSSITQTVSKAPTTTSLAALPTTSTSNQQITLTAVVNVPAPASGTPSGTVQFMDATSNTVLGTAPLTVIGGVMTASANTTQLNQAGAPRLLTAAYSGDINYAGSTSPGQPQSVFGTQIAVTNAAGYSGQNFSPDGAAAIFVDNLVNTVLVANTLPLPNSLGGVTVTVTDSSGVARQAALYFISPTQINFLMPTNTAFGLATITVTNASGATASGIVLVTHTAPGIFTANQNGEGIAQALILDVSPTGGQTTSNTAGYDPTSGLWNGTPITMTSTDSYFLELYGTGIRYVPANGVTATINGVSVPVQYAGAQPQFPGLDQVNLGPLPAGLAGKGTVNVVVTVAGQAANTVTVTFQ